MTKPAKTEIERARLISDNLHIVKIIARQISMSLPSNVDVNDLVSAGTIGLIESVERFDVGRGVQFCTFASIRIRGAIMDELRRSDWMTRTMREKSNLLEKAFFEVEKQTGKPAETEEVARFLGISNDDFNTLVGEVAATSAVNIDDFCNAGGGDQARRIEFIKDPYGRDPMADTRFNEIKLKLSGIVATLAEKEKALVALYYYDEMTFGEIGSILDITESRVSQMHSQIMAKLKGRFIKAVGDHGTSD